VESDDLPRIGWTIGGATVSLANAGESGAGSQTSSSASQHALSVIAGLI
jgi:hypothetical protein